MRRILGCIMLGFLLSACGGDRFDVDVSDIQITPVKITRFDQAVFTMDTADLPAARNQMGKTWGSFYEGFYERIICPGTFDQPICDQQIKSFIHDHDMRSAYNECAKKFTDFTASETAINDAYRHFKYYFPKRNLPKKVHVLMSGFNYNIMHIEGEYGIGLEMYLGADAMFYTQMQTPNYRKRKQAPEYLVPDFVKAWMMNEFPLVDEKGDLLTKMIYDGKLLYLQKALMPQTPDTIRFGYTAKQLEWAQSAEADVWAYLIEKKFLYNTNPTDIIPLVNDGPFTTGFSHDSPPRLASWIGLRIVETYMENNPDVTIERMLLQNDAQVLLNKSKYKPKF